MSEKVLVTGGAGFIGSVLVRTLLGSGDAVTVVDAAPAGEAWRLADVLDSPRLGYAAGDVRSPDLQDVLATGYDVVYHLSSNTENRGGRAEPNADFAVTAGGTVALLRGLAPAPPRVVVLTSSQLVYGSAAGAITESGGHCRPQSLFAAGKVAAEAFLSAYTAEYGIRSAACRLSNVVGGGMRRGIIHDFVAGLRSDDSRIKVLGNGRQTRSYLDVEDCVSGLLAAASADQPGFTAYNVCNTTSTSAVEVAQLVADVWPGRHRPEVELGEGERGWTDDVPTLDVHPQRLLALGWRPRLGSADAVRAAAMNLIAARAE